MKYQMLLKINYRKCVELNFYTFFNIMLFIAYEIPSSSFVFVICVASFFTSFSPFSGTIEVPAKFIISMSLKLSPKTQTFSLSIFKMSQRIERAVPLF